MPVLLSRRLCLPIAVSAIWLAGLAAAHAQAPNAVGYTPLSSGGLNASRTVAAAGSLVVMTRPGNVYQVSATNASGAGFLLAYDAIAAPADGAGQTPIACLGVELTTTTRTLSFSPGPALAVKNGLVLVYSTGANCYTQTTGTAFLQALAVPSQQ